jgi:serine phosphatase RsbU (regulator of sigma subunit)
MPAPREGWTSTSEDGRAVSVRGRGADDAVGALNSLQTGSAVAARAIEALATRLPGAVREALTLPSVRGAPSAAALRPRVAVVGRLRDVRRRRLLTKSFDLVALDPHEATDLTDAGYEVVLLDASLGARALSEVLAPLVPRDESSRPAILLVLREGSRLRLRPAHQAVIDDVVGAELGERQVLARVQAAVRVRGWLTERSRKNAELQGLYARLEVLAHRMAEELRLASNVQRSLLPPPLQHARLEVAREFIPFREIGGDFYDFVPLGPHRMAFAIGDVMGKGVPAALLAANLKASIRAQVEAENVCPSALVAKVNRMFWDVVPKGLFASLFFGVFDLDKGRLDYVNAGHHHPFVVTPSGSLRDLTEGGIVLGLTEDATYEQASVPVARGELFVFYSDGVTDRASPSGELFTVERLKEAARRAGVDSARITLYSLLGEVQGWSDGAQAEDDMTLVVARAR